MNPHLSASIHETWSRVHSPIGLPFPATVQKLQTLGVTHYHVDYIASKVSAYIGSGEAAVADTAEFPVKYAPTSTPEWNSEKVVAAIRKAQAGEGNYEHFSKGMIEAGVTNYFACFGGRRVVYLRDRGDVHT